MSPLAKKKVLAKKTAKKTTSGRGTGSRKTGTRGKSTFTLDFSGVESMVLVPEGEFQLKVESATPGESAAGHPKWDWRFRTVCDEDEYNDQLIYHTSSLQPQALWSLAGLLAAMGVEVPTGKGKLKGKFAELKDLMFTGTIEHEVYEGRKRARLVDWASLGEGEGETVTVEDEEEGGTEGELPSYSDDEIGAMSQAELEDVIDTYQLGEAPDDEHLLDLSECTTLRKKRNAVIDALEAAGYLEGGS